MLSAASKPVWRRIVSQGQGSGRFLFTPAVTRRPYAAVAARRVKGGSRVQKSALRRVWEAVSPRARPELIFNSYTRHPGATGTLLCLVGANVAVYIGWKWIWVSQTQQSWDVMHTFFLQHSNSLASGQLWALVLPSISHQAAGHLLANMIMLVYLGRRIHGLLGRRHFLGLYIAAAIAGSLATDAAYRSNYLGMHEYTRTYFNVLQGEPAGQQSSLGASDAVLGMLGFWYMAFPRAAIHVWRGYALMEPVIASMTALPQRLRGALLWLLSWPGRVRFSALWLLPAFFMTDAAYLLSKFLANRSGNPELVTSHTNHAAHAGGFLAGVGYYWWQGRKLKRLYAPHLLLERDPRRMYLMALSLAVWGSAAVGVAMLRQRSAPSLVVRVKDDDDAHGQAEGRGQGGDGKVATGSHTVTIALPHLTQLELDRSRLPATFKKALDDKAPPPDSGLDKLLHRVVPRLVGELEEACACANASALHDVTQLYKEQVAAGGKKHTTTTTSSVHSNPICEAKFAQVNKTVQASLGGGNDSTSWRDTRHRALLILTSAMRAKELEDAEVVSLLAEVGALHTEDVVRVAMSKKEKQRRRKARDKKRQQQQHKQEEEGDKTE